MKRYIIGLTVDNADELPQAARNIQAFVDTLGLASEMEVQVAINPLGSVPVNTHAIGFVAEGQDEEYYEEGDE